MARVRTKLIKRVSLFIGTLLVLLILLEMSLRIFMADELGDLTKPLWHIKDHKLIRDRIHEKKYAHMDFGTKHTVRYNRYGFRSVEIEEDLPKNKKRILILGDSYLEACWCEEKYNPSLVLQIVLNKLSDEEYEVINGAIRGTDTDVQYMYAAEVIPRFKPDIVLHFYCPNDLRALYQERYYALDDQGELQKVSQPFNYRRMFGKLYLVQALRMYGPKLQTDFVADERNREGQNKIEKWRKSRENYINWLYPKNIQMDLYNDALSKKSLKSLAIFEKLILNISSICHSANAQYHVVAGPTPFMFELPQLRNKNTHMERIGKILSRNNISFIDLKTHFGNILENKPLHNYRSRIFFLNDLHWNEFGILEACLFVASNLLKTTYGQVIANPAINEYISTYQTLKDRYSKVVRKWSPDVISFKFRTQFSKELWFLDSNDSFLLVKFNHSFQKKIGKILLLNADSLSLKEIEKELENMFKANGWQQSREPQRNKFVKNLVMSFTRDKNDQIIVVYNGQKKLIDVSVIESNLEFSNE